jgi:hypothetical protein
MLKKREQNLTHKIWSSKFEAQYKVRPFHCFVIRVIIRDDQWLLLQRRERRRATTRDILLVTEKLVE